MNKFIAEEHDRETRLDVFLTDKLGRTRSQIKRNILEGLVLVNEKPAKVHQFLRLNDVIEINEKT